ncbi:MAG TPA: hypothetical protein VGJ37_16595, partial [Pyrinomonadaceae bacterium]
SWQANIITTNPSDSYREFMLEYQDLQLAYLDGSKTAPSPAKDQGWRDASHAINAANFPEFGEVRPRLVSTGNIPITGTMSVNYRNEPISFRIGTKMPGSSFNPDLSYAFDNQAALKGNPNSPNPDPITPLMRAYQGDNVQVRVLVGAHVFAHQFNLMGPTWFAEPSWQNSGYRSNQPMGLSEHFELLFKVPSSSAPIPVAPATTVRQCPDGTSSANCVDYLYSPSLDETGLAHGLWGIFRSYDPTTTAQRLQALPNNPVGAGTNVTYATCPSSAPKRIFNVTAVTAQKGLAGIPQFQVPGTNPPQGELIFNDRGQRNNWIGSLMGIMYVRNEDLQNGQVRSGTPIEPLILRANAGDCITVNLTNALAAPNSDLSQLKVYDHKFNWPSPFNGNNSMPGGWQQMSHFVGLHPQLLSYDAATSFGWNVGWNSKGRADQFANFGEKITYTWYAGKIDRGSNGSLTYTPVEFGALNLFPSDPLFQHPNGLIGQMIIEPQGSTWTCGEPNNEKPCDGPTTPTTRASATVKAGTVSFREFSVMISDALFTSDTTSAINYRSEPKNFRYAQPGANTDFSCMTSNMLVLPNASPTQTGEPKTPIFRANIGNQVRFRMTHPMGTGDSQVFTVHGHAWQRNPYQKNSLIIGDNNLSQWLGSRDNHGSSDHFDLVIPQAGGKFGRVGDYLYTTYLADQASLGSWGIFRVGDPATSTQGNAVCKNQQIPPTTTAVPAPADNAPTNLRKRFHRQPSNPGGSRP